MEAREALKIQADWHLRRSQEAKSESEVLGLGNLVAVVVGVPVWSLVVFLVEPKTWPILAFFVLVIHGGIAVRCIYMKRFAAREERLYQAIMPTATTSAD